MELNKIHEDKRGAIFSVTGKIMVHEEVSFLQTNMGFARGGCIHRIHAEHLTVIEGHIDYYYRLPNENDIFVERMKAGESITIPPNTPHYMISITDSIIAEWGCQVEEKQEKHEEFRKIVMAHNEDLTK